MSPIGRSRSTRVESRRPQHPKKGATRTWLDLRAGDPKRPVRGTMKSGALEHGPDMWVYEVMMRSLGIAIGVAVGALGCSFNEAPASGCIEGQELRCNCEDDSIGVHTC